MRPRACVDFVRTRWRGQVALAEAFWTEMLLVGTGVNVGTTLLAMLLLAADAPVGLAAAAFFAPLPLNVVLVVSVWRSAEAAAGPSAAAARLVALVWLLAATVL